MPGPETQDGQEEQGKLFDGSPDGQPAVTETTGVDAEEFAEIRNNPLVRDLSGVYNRPVSDAAKDQGWGVELPEASRTDPVTRSTSGRELTSAEKNANARKAEKAHEMRARWWRQDNRR